jgi:hypothetical protein
VSVEEQRRASSDCGGNNGSGGEALGGGVVRTRALANPGLLEMAAPHVPSKPGQGWSVVRPSLANGSEQEIKHLQGGFLELGYRVGHPTKHSEYVLNS